MKQPEPSEREFTAQILEQMKLLGWRTAHFRTAQTARGNYVTPVAGDGKGFPDIIAVRGTRMLAVELKVGYRKLTAEQDEWLTALRLTGCEVYVWRPRDEAAISLALR